MVHRRDYTPVESVIDINDDNILWSYIPGFNGYEVSNNGYLRSMKHFRKYPYGILICPVNRAPYGDSCDPMFELSNDNNERVKIRLSQLIMLAANNKYSVSGYPRHTYISDCHSRNDRHFVNKYIPPVDNTAKYAQFTVIQDGTEMPHMEYQGTQVKVPISSIEGTEFYGRKDCRVVPRFSIEEK